MTDPVTIIIIAGTLALFLAGLTQGLTGFGLALVAVSILVNFLSPKVVIPMIVILSIVTNSVILFESRKWVDLKRIWPLMVTGIAGMPLGTYLLVVLDVGTLRVFIGIVMALFAIAFLMGFSMQIKNEKVAFAPVGLVSGLLQGSTSLSGPPVILFFVNQGVAKQVFRANLVAYFTVLSLATVPAYAIGGLITGEVLKYVLWFLLPMIIGVAVGIKLAHKIEERLFRNIALVIVTIAGLLSIASGLGILS